VGDPLAPTDALEDAGNLVALHGRHKEADVTADGLLGGIAEDPLGPGVPARDGAVERLADDRVVGRFDDGGQAIAGLLVGFLRRVTIVRMVVHGNHTHERPCTDMAAEEGGC
jgi:hypothetical protein